MSARQGEIEGSSSATATATATGGMKPQSSAVVLLHLRRLDRFLKHQGLRKAAHTLERESLAYLDAAHLRKLVKGGDWDAAFAYLRPFSPLWEGEGKGDQFAAFLHILQHHGTLHYFACSGDQAGREASDLFWWSSSDDFRTMFPELAKRHDFLQVVQRHELYRSMASEQARASLDWEAMKLTTLEKLQELLHLCPELECRFRMREPRRMPNPSEITPLGLRGCRRHQRKRVDRKPARELALFLLQKRASSSQEINHSSESGDSSATLLQPTEAKSSCYISTSAAHTGRKRQRCQDDYCTGNAQQDFAPTDCFKRPRIAGDDGEPMEKVETFLLL